MNWRNDECDLVPRNTPQRYTTADESCILKIALATNSHFLGQWNSKKMVGRMLSKTHSQAKVETLQTETELLKV